METAYFVLEGAPRGRSHRLSRVAQIVAINELLKPDLRNHARNEVSGLWPIEVHWLGKQAFRVVCLVGEDASRSPLLKPHRDGNVMHDVRIFLQKAGQAPPGEARATCLIPQCDFVLPRSSSSKPQGNRGDMPCVMNHTSRVRMAGAIVDDALRTVSMRLFDLAKHPQNVFGNFWHDYERGARMLARTNYNDIRALALEWRQRFEGTPVHPVAHPPGPLRPQELDHDTREAEWPAPLPAPGGVLVPLVAMRTAEQRAKATRLREARKAEGLLPGALLRDGAAAFRGTVLEPITTVDDDRVSTVSSNTALSDAETILAVSVKLDDLQRLFEVAGGSPMPGNIWAGGPSPAERKYFGMKDVAACGRWGKADTLFDDQPWR